MNRDLDLSVEGNSAGWIFSVAVPACVVTGHLIEALFGRGFDRPVEVAVILTLGGLAGCLAGNILDISLSWQRGSWSRRLTILAATIGILLSALGTRMANRTTSVSVTIGLGLFVSVLAGCTTGGVIDLMTGRSETK